MPLKMTIGSAVGVAAVAAATLMAPAMAANSSAQKACPSFTDSHRPGKIITSQLGTKGGFTCASGKSVAKLYFAGKKLPAGVVVAKRSAKTVAFNRVRSSPKAREAGDVGGQYVCYNGICLHIGE
jgi:hypothetical protein